MIINDTLKLHDEEVESIVNFSRDVAKQNSKFYSESRGQSNEDLRHFQRLVGTYAEVALNDLLGAKNWDRIIELYPRGKFVPDLEYNDMKISVKSQIVTAGEKWGKGAVFQASDKLFKSSNDITHIGYVLIDTKGAEYEIKDYYIKNKDYIWYYIPKWEVKEIILVPADKVKDKMVPTTKTFTQPKLFLRYEDMLSLDELNKYVKEIV